MVKTAAKATHKPIPHIAIVDKLIEALSFRQIGVVREESAVPSDGMRMFARRRQWPSTVAYRLVTHITDIAPKTVLSPDVCPVRITMNVV
jgi:hypothetical protein